MRAGKLRHRVTIQRKTGTRDADGGERVTWADLSTNVAASIEPLNGREFFASQAAQSEITGKITFRYPRDVRADDRVVHLGVFYNVHAAPETNLAHREIVCMVSQGVNDGR
jgi:SPP1 family predicted phage head-tail adaptor